jgi:aminopeptidase YwaD
MQSRMMQHLRHLCLEIGPRPVGSAANHAAASYVEEVFRDLGLEVERQAFSCPDWFEGDTILELAGRRLEAAANAFSPPCDVVAPAVSAGTLAELEAAELAGRIAILYGDLTKGHGLSCRQAFYFPDRDRHIMEVLQAKRPSAVITVHSRIGSFERLLRDWEFPIPSATVPAEVGRTLLCQTDPSLHLRVETHRSPGRFHNIIARKLGARPDRVLLLAHLDTMHNTPGAVDNASGVAVLLALAETFAVRNLPLGLEWVAVNGEENGGLGDVAYLRQEGEGLEQVLVAINVDGVGGQVGANSLTVMGASQLFQDRIAQIHRDYSGVVWIDPWYESDHSAFLSRGVPCIPISSVGVSNTNHMPTDTVEWISPAKLCEVVSLATAIVETLQHKAPDWCRERPRKQQEGAGEE